MNANAIKSLKEIKTPLAFLSLTVLVAEAVLLYLMKKARGSDLTILLVGCVLLPFACLLTMYLMSRQPGRLDGALAVREDIQAPSGKAYDLFVSAPMAAFETEAEYQASRKEIFAIVKSIKKYCKFDSVSYAGNEIESQKEFESTDLSVVEDYDACFRSTYFLLIYPLKIVTSALIELGWPMALKKPIIIFTKARGDLPFLARNADAIFSNLRIYEYKSGAEIIQFFHTNGKEILEQLAAPAKKPL